MEDNSAYKILIVDDVPTNIMLVQAILRKEGYTLITTDNGIKALELVKELKPNLILLDIMMPGMDGYEVLTELKANPETQDIPVIIMSALSDMQSIVKGYQLGAIEYVTKPFQREELIKRISLRHELFNIKRIRQELEETIKSRDKLYSIIAHDLRSPIGSLQMMNNAILMMIDKEQVSHEVYEMLQMMNKTSEDVYQLLENLLQWAKNQQQKQTPQKQEIDIHELIKQTTSSFAVLTSQKKLTLHTVNMDEPLNCIVDPDMVKTIMRNLISNAIKFSYEDGEIVISSDIKDKEIIISVEDNGTGIKKVDQEKLLNRTTHFTTYGTNNEKGAGLGLMLCKDFAEAMGGKLWFRSDEGNGTTFFLSLMR